MLLSNAAILHEGLATNKGTRYILVGFDSIDSFDPLTGERTNLSLFSSWLNFSWMQIRFKEGFQDGSQSRLRILNDVGDDLAGEWKYSRYAVGLFSDLNNAMVSRDVILGEYLYLADQQFLISFGVLLDEDKAYRYVCTIP